MDLKDMATQLLASKLGSSGNTGALGDAIEKLIGEGNQMDLPGMLSQLNGGGLGDALQSWLGDGANSAISGAQLAGALGQDKISAFAKAVGIDNDTAGNALADALPQLIDKNSSGGNLLSSLGGLSGLASKLGR